MQKRRLHRKKLVLAVAAALLLILVSAAAAGALYVNSKMDLLTRPEPVQAESGISPDEAILSLGEGGQDTMDLMKNGGRIQPPAGDVYRDPDITNILIIGSDEREGSTVGTARSDTLMLVSVDSRNNTWKLASFERGVGVSIPGAGDDDWLTHTYAYGGADLVLQTLRQYFKVDVSRYVKVDFTIFETAITDIGGVEVEMSQAEAAYMNQLAGEQKWQEGPARLDGPTALVYARMRKLDSDWNRMGRQQQVVQAAADQVAALSLPKMDLIMTKLLPMVETNLTNGELWQLLFKMPALLGKEADRLTVPDRTATWTVYAADGTSLIGCDFAAEAQRLNDFLQGQLPAA